MYSYSSSTSWTDPSKSYPQMINSLSNRLSRFLTGSKFGVATHNIHNSRSTIPQEVNGEIAFRKRVLFIISTQPYDYPLEDSILIKWNIFKKFLIFIRPFFYNKNASNNYASCSPNIYFYW